jgi:phosphopantetheinyl transferase
VFTQDEVSQLEALPVDERAAAFFNAWTRMEALAKASGLGLSLIPRKGISLPPEIEETSTVKAKDCSGHEAVWQIVSLRPGLGYKGAVAAEGSDWKIECMEWCY